MTDYTGTIDALGLREWCDGGVESGGPMTMEQLLNATNGTSAEDKGFLSTPFPSLDVLHNACGAIPRTRDMTAGIEDLFLAVKAPLKAVLDPITQPLSWALDGALAGILALPWMITIPLIMLLVFYATRSFKTTFMVFGGLLVLSLIDHYTYAMQTLAIIMVCTVISVLFGIPIGIAMSRSDRLQRVSLPILDLLQTLPTFVYLIPLIFLFSVTEAKLYGIAIILYAIVPVIRLTDLGIRLVDKDVLEAVDSFGMSSRQRLMGVEIPLAMPNIMAGVNQTIMMSLAMVVIASLVSAPGLGTLVLRGINKLELGVGLVAGLGIVILAILLDRVTKTAMARVNRSMES